MFLDLEKTYGRSLLAGNQAVSILLIWPRGYKTFFMLNLAEHEFFPANKC